MPTKPLLYKAINMPRSNVASFVGVDHPNAKLSEDDVRGIKRLLRDGYRQKDIANLFHISLSTISAINQDKIWRHIEIS